MSDCCSSHKGPGTLKEGVSEEKPKSRLGKYLYKLGKAEMKKTKEICH